MLNKSKLHFSHQINSTTDSKYKTYWSKCGLSVCNYLLGKKIEKKELLENPENYIERSRGYPALLLILAKSNTSPDLMFTLGETFQP